MPFARITSWITVFFTVIGLAGAKAQSPAMKLSSDVAHWVITYDVPEDVTALTLTLAYRFWDVNVDGDLASKRVLFEGKVKLKPGQKQVSIAVSLSAKKSEILVDGGAVKPLSGGSGKGFPLDASFAWATVPKTNENLAYVLARKPVDPKNPAALGDAQESSAWIELGIVARP